MRTKLLVSGFSLGIAAVLSFAATVWHGVFFDDELGVRVATTNLVSTLAPGLVPNLPNDPTKYLNGQGGYSVPTGTAAGVTTFNARNGTVTLTAADVNSVANITNNTTGGAGRATNAPTGVQVADTNIVTIFKTGLVPILPNDSTKFLNGVGAWAVPPGGGAFTKAGNGIVASTNSSVVTVHVDTNQVPYLNAQNYWGAASSNSFNGTGESFQDKVFFNGTYEVFTGTPYVKRAATLVFGDPAGTSDAIASSSISNGLALSISAGSNTTRHVDFADGNAFVSTVALPNGATISTGAGASNQFNITGVAYATQGFIPNWTWISSGSYQVLATDSSIQGNGTNKIITMPNGTNGIPTGAIFRIINENVNGMFIITNATGDQYIEKPNLSITNRVVTLLWDGGWWEILSAR